MRYQVRHLVLGGILDQAIRLTKDHFGLLLGIAFVLLIPYAVVQGFIAHAVTPTLPPQPTQEEVTAYTQAQLRSLAIILPLAYAGLFVILPITNAAMAYALANAYLEKPISIGGAFQHAFRRLVGLIWTWVLLGLAIMGGFMLCIIPGILASFWFSLATQVVVIEGTSGVAALKRSKQLMTGNIGTLFVLGLLLGIINMSINGGAALIPQEHLSVLLSAVAQGVAAIFGAAAMVVFYFSCRCQHEHFDLTLLAQAVGAEPPTAVDADVVEGA